MVVSACATDEVIDGPLCAPPCLRPQWPTVLTGVAVHGSRLTAHGTPRATHDGRTVHVGALSELCLDSNNIGLAGKRAIMAAMVDTAVAGASSGTGMTFCSLAGGGTHEPIIPAVRSPIQCSTCCMRPLWHVYGLSCWDRISSYERGTSLALCRECLLRAAAQNK
jgi:hypothetical protein